MSDLTDDARYVLAAWQERLITTKQVVRWADGAIGATAEQPIPRWLLDLSAEGPEVCRRRPSSDFLDVPDFGFGMGLAIRSSMLDKTDAAQMASFVSWISRACIGEDLSQPEVQFGYQVDHLWCDCSRMDLAQDLVRDQLAALAPILPTVPRVLRDLLAGPDESG